MLNALPRTSLRVFGDGPINSMKTTFLKARRRLASKLQNPRPLQIHFHTFRHWRTAMEYHRTKDLLHVMTFLGHKKCDNTLLYVQLDQKLFKQYYNSFTARVADAGQAVKSSDWQKGFRSVNSIRSGLTSFSVLSLSTIP